MNASMHDVQISQKALHYTINKLYSQSLSNYLFKRIEAECCDSRNKERDKLK